MGHLTRIAAACVPLALLSACATMPDEKAARPSEFTITTHNSTYVAFFATLAGGDVDQVVRMELWYKWRPVANFRTLEKSADSLRVVAEGWFGDFAQPYADVRVYMTNDQVHIFRIGDPVINDGAVYPGLKYQL